MVGWDSYWRCVNDNDLFLFSKLMAQRYNIYTTIYNVHMQSKDGKYS